MIAPPTVKLRTPCDFRGSPSFSLLEVINLTFDSFQGPPRQSAMRCGRLLLLDRPLSSWFSEVSAIARCSLVSWVVSVYLVQYCGGRSRSVTVFYYYVVRIVKPTSEDDMSADDCDAGLKTRPLQWLPTNRFSHVPNDG